MKKLNQFVRFLFEDFSKGKVYRVIGVRPWIDYTTKEHMVQKSMSSLLKIIQRMI